VPVTVNANKRTVVHAKSSGMVIGFPDVCLTSSPAGPIPIPYPNIAMSSDTSDGTKDVKADGESFMVQGSAFSTSTGDEAGSVGGIMSMCTKGKAKFLLYSFDVKAEGKNVCRLADIMLLNQNASPNTPPFPEIQGPAIALVMAAAEDVQDEDNEIVEIEFL